MDVKETGIVFRNPSPHVRSRHAYFPSLVVRPDGSLLVSMDIGSAFEAIDVRSYVSLSNDNGGTWTAPVKMFEPDTSKNAVSVTTRVGQCDDGALVGWVALFDRKDTENGLVNPATDGFVDTTFATIRSADAGRTWTPPAPLRMPVSWNSFEACSPPVQVDRGRWLVPASPLKDFHGNASDLPPGLVWTSSDAGRSLDGHVVTFAHDSELGLSALEQKLTRLSDGRWLVVCWSIGADGQTAPNRYAISTDKLATAFGPARSTGIKGETCTAIGLPENHVLCVYRNFERGGLWGQLAKLNDRDEWQVLDDCCLWDGSSSLRRAAPERWTELREMKDLRFGYPSIARLPDGDVFVVFWCVENCVSNIRSIRISVSKVRS